MNQAKLTHPVEIAEAHKESVEKVKAKIKRMVPVIKLVIKAGLSLLKKEGKSAKIKTNCPTERTISCHIIRPIIV